MSEPTDERADMAEYALFFRDESAAFDDYSEAQIQAVVDDFVTWTKDLAARGKFAGVTRLSMDSPRVLRQRAGGIVVDGPYAESKELINGFVVIKAEDDTEALALAHECPMLKIGGSVELRKTDDFPLPG